MQKLIQRIKELSSAKQELLLKKLKCQQKAPILWKNKPNHPTVMTVEELSREAYLEPSIVPEGELTDSWNQPKAILLTGATGFIGAFLLAELLEKTQADIYCLVRATSLAHARQRLQQNLQSYLIWDESKSTRIIPLIGDLGQPNLGLSAQKMQQMAHQIDVIYHCGALVKWTYPYKALKEANVNGTKEIIRLACQTKVKPLHFISTVGVFSSATYEADTVLEQEALEKSGPLNCGYAQSKWVAEKLVHIAGQRGLPITIHRPNTEGHSKTGVFNRHDHLCLITKGCINLGSAPSQLNLVIASAPIDYVSQAIIHLSQQQKSWGKVFHLLNPRSIQWSEWINLVMSLGYNLRLLPYSQWKTELLTQIKHHRRQELYALSPIFSDSMLEEAKLPAFDCSNTLAGLSKTSITCPSIDSKLLQTYFSYFVASGFLDAPNKDVSRLSFD